jgi:SAM-dependent methyltransferase
MTPVPVASSPPIASEEASVLPPPRPMVTAAPPAPAAVGPSDLQAEAVAVPRELGEAVISNQTVSAPPASSDRGLPAPLPRPVSLVAAPGPGSPPSPKAEAAAVSSDLGQAVTTNQTVSAPPVPSAPSDRRLPPPPRPASLVAAPATGPGSPLSPKAEAAAAARKGKAASFPPPLPARMAAAVAPSAPEQPAPPTATLEPTIIVNEQVGAPLSKGKTASAPPPLPERPPPPPPRSAALVPSSVVEPGPPSSKPEVAADPLGKGKTVSAPPPLRQRRLVTEELGDEDIAPDSGRCPPPLPSARDSARLEEPPTLREPGLPARPPPPPRRAPRPPVLDRSVEADKPGEDNEKKSLRRPWWEELFRDDFVRATPRDSPAQIKREADFIEQSLGVAAGGVILDLGCGAGYHAVELSSRGYGVVGYDLSLFQLALAAELAQETAQKINFLQGDMREMAFEEMFDGLYCWNTTFGYFEEDKNFLVAQHMFRALRPGGMLLLDVVNRDFAVAHQPSAVWYEGDCCVCMDDMAVDFITSRLRVKRSIILDDGRRRECHYSVRIYSLHELGKLLHEVGFRVTEATGHPCMPGVFFGENSPRIVILAQRP